MGWTLFIGINGAIWCAIGLTRLIAESRLGRRLTHDQGNMHTFLFFALHAPYLWNNKLHARAAFFAAVIGILLFNMTITGLNLLTDYHALSIWSIGILTVLWGASALTTGYLAAHNIPAGAIRNGSLAGLFMATGQVLILLVAAKSGSILTTTLPVSTLFVIALAYTISIIGGALGGFFEHLPLIIRAVRTHIPHRAIRHNSLRRIQPHEVATITPAHNEARTIGRTIESLKRILPAKNIHIASDASTDSTVEIARRAGVRVVDIHPNKGKAGAIVHGIAVFDLLNRYKALIIVDADSEVDVHYLERALPMFDDPQIAAIAVHAQSKWEPHTFPKMKLLYAAYRVRFYRLLQAMFKYGQGWQRISMISIIPGFASIYRTNALKSIEINAPGLVIEDFNMTFEVHRKKLGVVAYNPRVRASSQDPLTFKDYQKQVRRWNLGFWQTVKRHGIWPGRFWVGLGLFILELVATNILALLVPVFAVLFLLGFETVMIPVPFPPFAVPVTWVGIALGMFVSDIIMTIAVAIYERKYVLLWYAPVFPLLRYVDAAMFLYAFVLSMYTKSTGIWTSPKR